MKSSIATARTKSCFGKLTFFLAVATLTLGDLASPIKARSQEPDHRQSDIIDSKVVQDEKMAVVLFAGVKKQQVSYPLENLTVVLVIYTLLISAGLSLIFATASYHFADKRSTYTKARRNTALLSVACGLCVGIFVANFEAPPDHAPRLWLLFFVLTTGSVVMWTVTSLTFVFLRSRTLRQAKLEGLSYSDRMQQG
jgi:hypothetical protein